MSECRKPMTEALASISVGGIAVGEGHPCFVVAEIGQNHQGDVDLCKRLLEACKASGASAAKLQKRDLDGLLTKQLAGSAYTGHHAFGPTYRAHREALELGPRAWQDLMCFARELHLPLFATAFDPTSANFLADLGVPAIKVASGDALNWPLVDCLISLGLPIFASIGGLEWHQVELLVHRLRDGGVPFAVLQCTSTYPCPVAELELEVIRRLRACFPDVVVGYSGHEEGILPSIAAATLGASIIERHFTLDKSLQGADHRYSLTPEEFFELVSSVRVVSAALGSGAKYRHPSEGDALYRLGKKLVAARAIPAGHALERRDVAVKSPGDGLSPHFIEKVLGRRVRQDLAPDDALAWELLAPSRPDTKRRA
jgi:sialic acid synthase